MSDERCGEQLLLCADCGGMRLDSFLKEHTELSRSAAQKLIALGNVTVNGSVADKNVRLNEGDAVAVTVPPPVELCAQAENIPIEIVYEDDALLVVNKPQGMVVHPAAGNESGTLVNALLYHCRGRLSSINGVIRPGIVHRIDKDTSGLLIVAKTDQAHVKLAEQISAHSFSRRYHAIVIGDLKEERGRIDRPIDRHPTDRKKMAVCAPGKGRCAVTNYRVLEHLCGYTLTEFSLETGRTHQIRVHMASIGKPILGDPVYGRGSDPFERQNRDLLHGQCLHAQHIGFVHPQTGAYMEFDAPRPAAFEQVLEKLRNRAKGLGGM